MLSLITRHIIANIHLTMRCRGSRFIVFLVPIAIHFTICTDARTSVDMLKSISSVAHFHYDGIGTPDVSFPPVESTLPLPLPTIPPFPSPPLPAPAPAPTPAILVPPALLPPANPSPLMFPPGSSPPEVGSIPPQHTPIPPGLPPSNPPQQHKSPMYAVWCVAKPTVPDSIMQEAMDYACGTGADCKPIQPNGPCFQPNTPLAHAAYAFNSYFQNQKNRGGTCDFGGTAMLVTFDPSYDDCHFNFN